MSFNLDELHALPIPRCTPENLEGLPEEYLKTFVAPRLNRAQDGVTCIGCGATLWTPNLIMGFLSGATFTWDVAHGEGRCSGCGYPTRMYHKRPEGTASFPIQYHPDEIERN